MSIEAMKRIKSLLQDGDKIDSHTISAVVAECDAVILAPQPATGEPVKSFAELREKHRAGIDAERAKLYATSVPEFSRIAKRKMADLQEQGFTITGYAIQRGTQRGFITNGGFVGWWRSDETTSVPDDVVRDAIAAVREQYRGTDWGKAAECICDAIDAAMLAAK